MQTITNFIRQEAEKNRKSNELNYALWGYSDVANSESEDYDEAVDAIIESYSHRLFWLNEQIAAL